MLLSGLITLRIQILDQERVDHPPVDHELFAFYLILDLLNQFSCIPFHLVSFSLNSIPFLPTGLVLRLETLDLTLKLAYLLQFCLRFLDLILQVIDCGPMLAQLLLVHLGHLVAFVLFLK